MTRPTIHTIPLNLAQLVCLEAQHYSSRYERYQTHTCLTTDTFSLGFHWVDLSNGGATGPFHYPRYGLQFGDGLSPGVELGSYTVKGTEIRGYLQGNLGTLADGPYMVQPVAYDSLGAVVANPTECLVPYWLWVDRHGQAKDCPDFIIQNGNYNFFYDKPAQYVWIRVPKTQLKTRAVPTNWWNIPTKEIPVNAPFPGKFPGGEPFVSAPSFTNITRVDWVASYRNSNFYRPCITTRGITVCENIQGYLDDIIFGKLPKQSCLDGPRGVASLFAPTALMIGHSANIYGLESHSLVQLAQNGARTTLGGLRHQYAIYWRDLQGEDAKNLPKGTEIVGNWDPSIQPERRFPWEGWGLVNDPRASAIDPSLPPADRPPFGQLPQHVGVGPVFFSTCRFGRILKYQFDKNNQFNPPTITEWVTGLADPWGLAIKDDGSALYVSERGAHKITKWSTDLPNTKLATILENVNGAQFGGMDPNMRRWKTSKWLPNGTPDYATLRTQTILWPEGLDYQDGMLYFGSLANAEVRRVTEATGKVEICCRVTVSQYQSRWIELKLSDGTFNLRGTIFTGTYDNGDYGRPKAWMPHGGTDSDGTPTTHTNWLPPPQGSTIKRNEAYWHFQDQTTGTTRGPGYTEPMGYTTGIAVGNGLLACGSTQQGLAVFMLNTIGAKPIDKVKLNNGNGKYVARGYEYLFGQYGYGHVDTPLPWGEDADIDYYLTTNGHSQTSAPDTTPPATPVAPLNVTINWK